MKTTFKVAEVAALMSNNRLGKFISLPQKVAMNRILLRSEEASFMADIIVDLDERIQKMPKSYQTDGQGGKAIAYLHYFKGGCDWYITEKDMDGDTPQAFGRANIGYGGELGYISIDELVENNVELDLYWKPIPLSEIAE